MSKQRASRFLRRDARFALCHDTELDTIVTTLSVETIS